MTAAADSDSPATDPAVRPAPAPRSRYRREAGLAVTGIGRSSVTYEIGIFAAGAAVTAAHGRFVHVYVARRSRRPEPLPDRLRAFAKALQ